MIVGWLKTGAAPANTNPTTTHTPANPLKFPPFVWLALAGPAGGIRTAEGSIPFAGVTAIVRLRRERPIRGRVATRAPPPEVFRATPDKFWIEQPRLSAKNIDKEPRSMLIPFDNDSRGPPGTTT